MSQNNLPKSNPAISVIMPVFNGEDYLAEAITSILEQTFTDFEFIIIDDGSTDDSLKILRKFKITDSRIVLISRPNRGITPTLNEGISLARGTFIARMDADDICLPDRFEKQVNYLKNNPHIVALGGQAVLIDPHSRELVVLSVPIEHADIDKANYKSGAGIWHPTVMMRRNALQKVKGYREKFLVTQDIDLWLRLAEIGNLANLSSVVLKYRQNLSSIGYTKRHKQRISAWQATSDAANRRGNPFNIPEPVDNAQKKSGSVFIKWGWWALSGGNIKTARIYAYKSILQSPFSLLAWKLFYCSLRGH